MPPPPSSCSTEEFPTRILVVNVNTTQSMTDTIAETARSAAGPDTEIVALTPLFGAQSVEGNYESYLAAVAVLETVRRHSVVTALDRPARDRRRG